MISRLVPLGPRATIGLLVAIAAACGGPSEPEAPTSGPEFVGRVTLGGEPQAGVTVSGSARTCTDGASLSTAETSSDAAGRYALVLPMPLGAEDVCIDLDAAGTAGFRIIGFRYHHEGGQILANLDETARVISHIDRPGPGR